MQSLKHLYSLYEDLLNQETNILHLKHKLSYVLLIRVQATISGDRLDPGNPAQHGGHSCSQRSERSAVFPRYQSAPSTSAPEAISCPRAAALESDLSILPPPHQPPPLHSMLYNFIFFVLKFIYRLVSILIEFNIDHTRYSCFAPKRRREIVLSVRFINCG